MADLDAGHEREVQAPVADQPPLALDQFPPPNWYDMHGQFLPTSAPPVLHTLPEYIPTLAALDPHPARIPSIPALPPASLPPPPQQPPSPPGREAPHSMPPGVMPTVPFAGLPQHVGPGSPSQEETAGPTAAASQVADPDRSSVPAAPDAISGADQPAPPQSVAQTLAAQGATTRTEGTPEEEAGRAYRDAYDALPADRQKYQLTPEQHAQARTDATRESARQEGLYRDMAVAAQREREQAQRDAAIHEAAAVITRQRRVELEQQIQQLATQKPDEHLPLGRGIMGIIASTIGGFASPFTGGRNLGLEGFEQSIARHVQVQQANIANQRSALGLRMQSLNEQEGQNQRDFSDANVVRATAYEQAIRQAQAEAQNYDPTGTTATRINGFIAEAQSRKQLSMQAWEQQDLKNRIEVAKTASTLELQAAQAEKERAEAAKALGKLGGGGSGEGPANTKYTVPTGIPSPYKDAQGNPVILMGTKALDIKGHEKEFSGAVSRIGGYSHEQDGLNRLVQLGAKIDYHKNVLHDWDKTQATLVDEYDKATHSLVVYMTKDLGDKLTQGQIEEQSKRIPALTKWLSQVDVGKELRDAQEESDLSFERDMSVQGVDARPVIATAKANRAEPVQPTSAEAIGAAQAGLAAARTSDERKAYQQSLATAKDRAVAEKQEEIEGAAAVKELPTMQTQPRIRYAAEGLPPVLAAEVAARNEAEENFHLQANRADDISKTEPKVNPKLKGDAAKIQRDHERLTQIEARKAANQQHALFAADTALDNAIVEHVTERDYGGIPQEKVDRIARRLGFDPSRFGDDTAGQVERGRFFAQLQRLDPAGRAKLRMWFFERPKGGE